MRTLTGLLVLGVLFATSGCVPVTLSKEDQFDFQKYKTVYVGAPTGNLGDWARDYVVAELTRRSGFQRVGTDAEVPADIAIWIDVSVEEVESDDGSSYEYTATFDVQEWSGTLLSQGSVKGWAAFEFLAGEDALNDVVDNFQRGYRL